MRRYTQVVIYFLLHGSFQAWVQVGMGPGVQAGRIWQGKGTWLSTPPSLSSWWCLKPHPGPLAAQLTPCLRLSGPEGFPGKPGMAWAHQGELITHPAGDSVGGQWVG